MRHKIREDLDHKNLEKLGYMYVILEAGYVSKDMSTIITTDRLGHKREVMQFTRDKSEEYKRNLDILKEKGYLENE
jgi:serine protease inhibitor ecotin